MNGQETVKKINQTLAWLKKRTKNFQPEMLIITGSGLSNAVPELEKKIVISYDEIPNFSKTTVSGHKGELWFGYYKNTPVCVMRGRFHFYEGHHMSFIAFPIRLINRMGAKKLIVTAAVGALKKKTAPGDLVLLEDQINMMADNPLIGNYDSSFGEMFVEMAEPYCLKTLNAMVAICKKLKIRAHKGVYFAVTGPAYETKSEVKMYALLGADVAGMSVVPEVIVARQLKMKVCGISWISNYATGVSDKEFDHSLVLKLGFAAGEKIKKIISALIAENKF